MAPLTLSGFAAIRSRRDPIVRIAHLVREIKFCDRQIGRLNATSALRHGHIAPVLTGSPPPVQVLFADALVRDGFAGVANLTSKAAQLLGDQCGASLHPCWKMPVGDLRRPRERASDGTKDLEANSAGPLAIGGRTSLSVGGNQRLTQWRLACASATSHILRYRLGYERALS